MIAASELYRGAGPYYARHGLTYPEDFFRSLVRICSLSNRTRALDLGAGTGQIAIPLARSVANVLFVNPSDEMVQEGRRMAEAAGAANIDFLVSRAEDIDEPTSSFDIATIAGSFLWMDQTKVLAKLAHLPTPDGCVVITNRERDGSEPGEWHAAMMSDIREFWGGTFPAGPGAVRPNLPPYREVLRASDFCEITELRHYYDHHWCLDDLLGYLYWLPGTLGARRDEFTTRMRRLLLSYSPSGSFVERGHHTTLLEYRH